MAIIISTETRVRVLDQTSTDICGVEMLNHIGVLGPDGVGPKRWKSSFYWERESLRRSKGRSDCSLAVGDRVLSLVGAPLPADQSSLYRTKP